MTNLFFFLLLLPFTGQAHPGIGIVKDSKGNIYYTDLKQVWKITNGHKTVIVPNVHTHELYIDKNDNLYGEGGYYDGPTEKFYHYLWVYRPNGQIDTVIGMKEAYVHQDFSLARDKNGNEYYIKRFLVPHTDTTHIYRKSPDQRETIFASGNFKSVNWLHPQDDGNLLYVAHNAIYKVDSSGKISLVKELIKDSENNITIWGVWQDKAKNIYAAVFSDQTIKKIDTHGNTTDIYKSDTNWAPLSGVFDNENKLWVLEGSDKNEVRVTLAEQPVKATNKTSKTNLNLLPYIIVGCIVVGILVFYLKFRNSIRDPEV